MAADVLVPGGRDVRATLDEADGDAEACVVACPPHPQHRGHRGDARLTAVGDALTGAGIDCLRFDYGEWDRGYGELADAHNALDWTAERYDRVGLFGFSFGACVSLLAAAGVAPTGTAGDPPALAAVSALAPASRLNDDLVAVDVMDRVTAPAQVVYGTRDDTADWEAVVDRARDLGWTVDEIPADHFFVGQTGKVAAAVGDFLISTLG